MNAPNGSGKERGMDMHTRKISKKIITSVLVLLMVLSLAGTCFAAPLGDPPGDPPTGGPGGAPGSQATSVAWTGAKEISGAASESGQVYASSAADENALLIDTEQAVTVTNPTVTKSGDSDGGDNCNFYGINSGIMVKGGGTVTISGGTISTTATGANGVFSYGGNGGRNGAAGDGTTVIISDTTITTTGDNAGGIMTTGGGVTEAENLTVTTSGRSSAPIRTDRGGGTVTVTGGTYTSGGLGSPAIYSTADITVTDATLVSNQSEGVCIEGKNSVTLTDCDLTVSNTNTNGNATFLDSVMIYQSMSGDADSGTSSFTMTGGSLTSTSGHVFHVTNTNAVSSLSQVNIYNTDEENILLSVCDDGWSGAENIATVNASEQTLNGTILVGSNSTLHLNLTDTTVYTGRIGGTIANAKGETVSTETGTVNVTLDASSTWFLTGDSYVNSFTGSAANVISNGYTLYVSGVALEGTTDRVEGWKDVPSTWAQETVNQAIAAGMVPGTLQTGYQSAVSRGSVAQMFVNLIELASGKSIEDFLADKGVAMDENAFTDTSDPAVLAANALGIIQGVGNGRFDPDANLTRAQIAAILNRAAVVLGVDTSGYSHNFTDVSDHWVDSELGWAVAMHIIEGRGGGLFDPDTAVTTQEAIAITYRALNALG